MRKLFAYAATAALSACTASMSADTTCESAVDGLEKGNGSVSSAYVAVKLRKSGCTEAKKLDEMAAYHAQRISHAEVACAGVEPKASLHIVLRQRIAVSEFHASLARAEVQRLCR